MSDVQQRIEELVKNNEVLLFMKGSASFPMCGFSGRAVQVLKACGVDAKAIKTVNVLDDADIRQGIKEFSNWPTIPQLYIKGEFIGAAFDQTVAVSFVFVHHGQLLVGKQLGAHDGETHGVRLVARLGGLALGQS